jgi:hypothetical protein
MTCFEFFMRAEYQIVTLAVWLWQNAAASIFGVFCIFKGKGESIN